MSIKRKLASMMSFLWRGISRVIDPRVLFPAIALVILAGVWGATLNLARVEMENAKESSRALTEEMMGTYEAQVVRALREISQDLQLVQYAYEQQGEGAMADLRGRDLLPPTMLFTVAVVDAEGELAAGQVPPETLVANEDFLRRHRQSDALQVAPPRQSPESGEWMLLFSQRLSEPDGAFAGVAVIEVDASFFVSSYESRKMHEQGLLGLLGTDGEFRIRRVGDNITAGASIDYQAMMGPMDPFETTVVRSVSPVDGIERYMSARQLYEFPLAVVVGLSREEQLAGARQQARDYAWRATGISILVLLVTGLLWRMSYKLAESRRLETEARIAHAEQVEYLAYHDGLTGLPNRSFFSKLLERSISEAVRYDRKLSVLFLDLDHFKHINDTLGHDAGDQLLQEVSRRLRECLRESDTIARLGGDEFVVLLPEIQDRHYVATVAQKIITAIARPYQLKGEQFRVTASVGGSICPVDGQDEETLTKNADIAMYKAKEQGKNNFQLYSDELRSESLERLTLESSLRHAIERDELKVYYQAKREVASGRVTGMEALLRWQHPDLGIIQPMRFIAIAEEAGLIIPMGIWVLKTVCEQNISWQQQGLPRLNVAVNLSTKQFFDEALPSHITSVLEESGMAAELLELEVSENVLMQNVDKSLAVINRLKELGVRIAIDNFGVGYSSLAMLNQFPLDAIKIDRSFIRSIAQPGEDRKMAEAVVAMGRTLGMTVVAQGVETEEELSYLRNQAYDELQGFYFSQPLPPDELSTLFRDFPGADPKDEL